MPHHQSPMDPNVWISQVKFNDETIVSLTKDDIVVFVGPNNAGKSASLKEIVELARSSSYNSKILKETTLQKSGSEEDLFTFLDSIAKKDDSSSSDIKYLGFGYSFYKSVAMSRWKNYQTGISPLFEIFGNFLTTEQRLKAANPPENIRLTQDPPKHPIHFLQKDDKMEDQVSIYFRQAFGKKLQNKQIGILPFIAFY